MSMSLRHYLEFLTPGGVPPPPPPQTINLSLLTDADVIYPPVVTQDVAIVLPLLSDVDTLHAPTVINSALIQLPLLSDVDVMHAPTVLADQAIALQLLVEADVLFPLVITHPGQTVILPQLVDLDTLYPMAMSFGAVGIALPFLDDLDTMPGVVVVPGPIQIDLDFLDDLDVIPAIFVYRDPLPVMVRASDRYWASSTPGPVRYNFGQSVEIRFEFVSADGVVVDPGAVQAMYQDPAGVETHFILGVDVALERVTQGTYRVRVVANQHGRWYYRAEGQALDRISAGEGSFVIARSEFEP